MNKFLRTLKKTSFDMKEKDIFFTNEKTKKCRFKIKN